jgi:hypothetical protein
MLAVGIVLVVWEVVLLVLGMLLLVGHGERMRGLHLRRRARRRQSVDRLATSGRSMGGGVLVVRVLVHGDREHSRGGVTCTVAAAVGSLR